MKKCNNCGKRKSKRSFGASGQHKDGLQSNCKECARVIVKTWYQENHHKARERREKWKIENDDLHRYHKRSEYLATCEDEKLKVYFVQGQTTKYIKIGQTALPVKMRLKNLQSGSPDKLQILLVLDNANEKALHQQFAAYRAHGEWFEPAPELLEFIKNSGNKIDFGRV